ncbi:MAG: malto-oligosyltrehalose trehalohydrolase [Phycisphaerae bacterium]
MSRAAAPGATYLGGQRCAFEVWAPKLERVAVEFVGGRAGRVTLARQADGRHTAQVDGVSPGARYFLVVDGQRLPDPASRYQPEGVHGPSEVGDPTFAWSDAAWTGVELRDCVLYELHVGTFTREGTFDAIHAHLPRLRDLGVTAIELLPVAQFPGARNWGYDGVGLYAVQNTYGGPAGLKRLVDACHRVGIALVLDVVYNHLGPEGNYLGRFAPYFTNAVRTPWGDAINFAGEGSDEVRRFFIANALRWIDEFHIDGLRLDAVHAVHDPTARPFLAELSEAVHERGDELGRRVLVIAESNQNDPRTVIAREQHGLGCDAQWVDDFHHALHVALTGERHGYYADFDGVAALAKTLREGFAYTGQHAPYRGRRHGKAPIGVPFERFIVYAQNHDQIGNRALGERLSTLIDFESLKLAAGATLLSPFVPLLFMGEECGERAPFHYFVSHSDEALAAAVRKGRREEFAGFEWAGEAPDPQSPETFDRCKLDHALCEREPHRTLWRFHQALLRLRRERPALRALDRARSEVVAPVDAPWIALRRCGAGDLTWTVLNFADQPVSFALPAESATGVRLLDSADREWRGPGSVAPPTVRRGAPATISLARRSVVLYAFSGEPRG